MAPLVKLPEPADGGETRRLDTRPPWIETRPGRPYFVTEHGESWMPIGQNDAVSWPELAGLFRRRDLAAVERHLRWLKDSGVTCLRLMLEYCQGEHRYLERPVGRFVPNMVALWDDLFVLLERVGLHVLLTPYDTFFMWVRWRDHPYRRGNGGPCDSRRRWLTCPKMREAVRARLKFATDRWGHSPALFAWDLWNEMHPAHAGDNPAAFTPFIDDIGGWLRDHEVARHGRAHLQTVSVFGPELIKHPAITEPIFRHAALDFATTHLYEHGTIDDPKNSVAPALAAGRLIRSAVAEARDGRPVFDTEHGPIHRFKDRRKTLPAAFDDEYFRHIQWAHLASGGAGGGMRWPNRHPHVLTDGMRRAQRALADFLPLIDWNRFERVDCSDQLQSSDPGVAALGCADRRQALIWLLRTRCGADGRVIADERPVVLTLPALDAGDYTMQLFDTRTGRVTERRSISIEAGERLAVPVMLATDLAIAVRVNGPCGSASG